MQSLFYSGQVDLTSRFNIDLMAPLKEKAYRLFLA
jgi:hypothetical protein